MNIQILQKDKIDLYIEDLIKIYIDCYGNKERKERINNKKLKKELLYENEIGNFFLLIEKNILIGYANIYPIEYFKDLKKLHIQNYYKSDIYITNISILQEFSKKSYGTKLLQYIIKSNKDKNIFLRYRADYKYLEKYYTKNGFTKEISYITEKNGITLERNIMKLNRKEI